MGFIITEVKSGAWLAFPTHMTKRLIFTANVVQTDIIRLLLGFEYGIEDKVQTVETL